MTGRPLTDDELRDAIASLRRTARDTRASRLPGWLATALDLERIADEREAELLARV